MYIRNTVELGDQVVRVKDLAKINLEWLAAHMPEKMLEEWEELKLREEGRIIEGKKYIPDAKIPILEFLVDLEFITKKKQVIKGFIFINEEGRELRVREFGYESTHEPYIEIESLDGRFILDNKIEFYGKPISEVEESLQYASFIDKVIGGNLEQQLKNEIGVFLEKAVKSNNKLDLRWI